MTRIASLLGKELHGRLFGTALVIGLFGVFLICTSIAAVILSRNLKLRRTRWALWYTFATLTMFTTTSIYSVFDLYGTFIIERATMSAIGSLDTAVHWNTPPDIVQIATHNIPLQYCVGTAALTINVIIGDAIVLGRAYVLYPKNRIIGVLLFLLLLGTLVTSIVSTAHSCQSQSLVDTVESKFRPESTGLFSIAGPAAGTLMGSFFEGDIFGIAASVISLATNITSTCLIGYRAWEHRALLRGNGLGSVSGRSRVLRALALLIESGAFYSAIWILVVVYQFITCPFFNTSNDSSNEVNPNPNPFDEIDASNKFNQSNEGHHTSMFLTFTAGWEEFTEGGLVIIIAIYPTIIMLLTALNRSECDTIASQRGNDQDAMVPGSLIFRDSAHHEQSLHSPSGGGDGSAPHASASVLLSSVVDLETADPSSEKGEAL